ncbi:hypothetical protein ACKKBF_B38815 [Auxenochlorella protothecoides x Auxenochlorella symbiontica]
MPRRQFLVMGVRYAPAAIRKFFVQQKVLTSGVRELRNGVHCGKAHPISAAHPGKALRSIAERPAASVWNSAGVPRATWCGAGSRAGARDAPSFASTPVFLSSGNPGRAGALEGSYGRISGSDTTATAPQHMRNAAASPEVQAPEAGVSTKAESPLMRWATLGLQDSGRPSTPPQSAEPAPKFRASLRKLASVGPQAPAPEVAPSKQQLRNALLAYAAM